VKIVDVKSLSVPDVKVIRYARFCDHRGYFTEHLRHSDFVKYLPFMKNVEFSQCNESYSKAGTIRGLHFQWNPWMGKLVRTLHGRMVDLFLDIRKGSPTFGKVAAYDMPADCSAGFGEWIWVPPGFAHGNFFTVDSQIEYFCSGEYSPGCEAGISPFTNDMDWSLCDPALKQEFDAVRSATVLMTEKDRNGYTLEGWTETVNSDQFVYERLKA
jgi:dTDP-4-dehydrorhamnose 3,5-epimerase